MHILKGQTLSFNSDPALTGDKSYTHFASGAVAVNDKGLIEWVGDSSDIPKIYASAQTTNHGDKLILPGFIDAHLHFPQYRMIAAYGKDLMDWLNRYTFIEEQRYGDKEIAENSASLFLDELARHGITSCLAFSTIHPVALDALFTQAQRRNMALASGKTLMDCNAPVGLCDTPESAYQDSTNLIKKWNQKGRLKYAISPRFAVTSSEAQLEATSALVKENPDLLIQTHLSENHGEIEFVASRFPKSKDYTDVYDHYGLLTENSLFAHGIHLSERELARLSESGSAIIHCPTSNNFLGSGHFRYHHTTNSNRTVKTGIGCDIGGGTSFSMLQTMRDAYTVSQHAGSRITAFEAFYLATLGNAKLLGFVDTAGTLEAGKIADIVVLDPQATPIMSERHALSKSLHDVLFALMIMGDDRAISETYIAGKPVKPAA
ncbi:MAG: guanine deaminase [Salaquimonas sp.]